MQLLIPMLCNYSVSLPPLFQDHLPPHSLEPTPPAHSFAKH